MAHCNTVFHTLAKILPRHEIDRLDKKYGQGDRRRKTSRYVQLIVMLMAQILGLKSLRDISPEDQHEYHFITMQCIFPHKP